MRILTYLRLLLKDLLFDHGRSLLTVISLAAVIVSYLSTSSASEVLQEFGSQPGVAASNMVIMSDTALEPGQSHMGEGVLRSIAEALDQEYGPGSVQVASPMLYRSLRYDNKRLQIIAVPGQEMQSVHHLVLLDGRWPSGSGEVVASREAFTLFGYQLGDTLRIRDADVRIVGRVEQPGARMAAVWMEYAAGQALFEVHDDFQLGYLAMSARLDLPSAQLFLEQQAEIPAGYAVYLERQLYELYYHFVADLLKIAYVLAALALGVVCFGVYNTTSLTLMERRRDAALLQTVGFSARMVRLFLLGRAALQALAAYLLAWGVTALIQAGGRTTIAIEAKTAVMRLSPGTLALGLALTLLSTALGVYLVSRPGLGRDLAGQLRV
jgi:hypothetical protein